MNGFIMGVLSSLAGGLLLRAVLVRLDVVFTFRRVMRDIQTLHKQITLDKFRPDTIVTIDRNGTIVGTILAGFMTFETVIAVATDNRRLPDGTREIAITEAHLPREIAINDKRVLLLICFNDSGTSLGKVYERLQQEPYRPREMRTAALFTSVSPQLKPHYFSREAGRGFPTSISQIVHRMPWMSHGWHHVFGNERLPTSRRW